MQSRRDAVTKTPDAEDVDTPKQGKADPASTTVGGAEAQPANRFREQADAPTIRTLASGAYGIKRRQDSGNSDTADGADPAPGTGKAGGGS
jgi:hypothetical protein